MFYIYILQIIYIIYKALSYSSSLNYGTVYHRANKLLSFNTIQITASHCIICMISTVNNPIMTFLPLAKVSLQAMHEDLM